MRWLGQRDPRGLAWPAVARVAGCGGAGKQKGLAAARTQGAGWEESWVLSAGPQPSQSAEGSPSSEASLHRREPHTPASTGVNTVHCGAAQEPGDGQGASPGLSPGLCVPLGP